MIILIGNKADLEAQRDVTYEEAKQFAEENGGFLLRLHGFLGYTGRISKEKWGFDRADDWTVFSFFKCKLLKSKNEEITKCVCI